jgi:hypothetical protein
LSRGTEESTILRDDEIRPANELEFCQEREITARDTSRNFSSKTIAHDSASHGRSDQPRPVINGHLHLETWRLSKWLSLIFHPVSASVLLFDIFCSIESGPSKQPSDCHNGIFHWCLS